MGICINAINRRMWNSIYTTFACINNVYNWGVKKMSRIAYKVLINGNEVAMFYDLELVMIFIKGACERYYNELKEGFDFTIKEELEK